MLRRLAKAFAVVLLFIALSAAVGAFAFRRGVSFAGPFAVRRPAATLSPALLTELDREMEGVTGADDAVQRALRFTARHLHFGLAHRTSLEFTDAEREGNCIEYSHLFASAVQHAASKAHAPVRAFVVHSPDAKVFGFRIPLRGFHDHDFALVDTAAGNRFVIDPTFRDAHLGADVEKNVRGELEAPPWR